MNYSMLVDSLTKMKHAVKDYQMEWQATRFTIDGKMFALIGENKEKIEIISLKTDPNDGQILRSLYPEITEGYYLNKLHWISIRLDGNLSDDIFHDLILKSYQLVYQSLSKKRQKELEQI
jgi:predicted DNA-binding protein (MmcQ/YjbR family)